MFISSAPLKSDSVSPLRLPLLICFFRSAYIIVFLPVFSSMLFPGFWLILVSIIKQFLVIVNSSYVLFDFLKLCNRCRPWFQLFIFLPFILKYKRRRHCMSSVEPSAWRPVFLFHYRDLSSILVQSKNGPLQFVMEIIQWLVPWSFYCIIVSLKVSFPLQ